MRTPCRQESVDLEEARHEQTILAYGINDRALPVEYGAPLRLRVERQLGDKTANTSCGSSSSRASRTSARAKGGCWEDQGYE